MMLHRHPETEKTPQCDDPSYFYDAPLAPYNQQKKTKRALVTGKCESPMDRITVAAVLLLILKFTIHRALLILFVT